jgi:tripartite-type tricarboxylate transporter receptor subunit TctC
LAVLGLSKLPGIPEVPVLSELARTEDQRKLIDVFMLPAEVGRSIIAPPGLPVERVQSLRVAFDAMVRDERFIAEAQKMGMEVSPLSGGALESQISRMKDLPPNLAKKARTLAAAAKR